MWASPPEWLTSLLAADSEGLDSLSTFLVCCARRALRTAVVTALILSF